MVTLYFLPKYRKQYISTHYILTEKSPVNDTNHPCGIDNSASYFTRPATAMKWLSNNILHTVGAVVEKSTFYHAATTCSYFFFYSDSRKSCETSLELYTHPKTPANATDCRIFTLLVANRTITNYLRRIRLLFQRFHAALITHNWGWTLAFLCFSVRRIICHSVSAIVLQVLESC